MHSIANIPSWKTGLADETAFYISSGEGNSKLQLSHWVASFIDVILSVLTLTSYNELMKILLG